MKFQTLQFLFVKSNIFSKVCLQTPSPFGHIPLSREVRILYLLVSIFSAGFPGTLAYIILWIVMPPKNSNTIYM
jgi:hypothetical protein